MIRDINSTSRFLSTLHCDSGGHYNTAGVGPELTNINDKLYVISQLQFKTNHLQEMNINLVALWTQTFLWFSLRLCYGQMAFHCTLILFWRLNPVYQRRLLKKKKLSTMENILYGDPWYIHICPKHLYRKSGSKGHTQMTLSALVIL